MLHGPVPSLQLCDADQKIPKKDAEKRLADAQLRLVKLQERMRDTNVPIVIVLEGPDASGKGGAIDRFTRFWDLRLYSIIPVAAPTEEEHAHHYLWRFWRDLPRRGKVAIFDRSWYGRVLVERVEGFATTDEWQRAYDEINHFEETLTHDDYLIVKFYMHVSEDEQHRRFERRKKDPFKSWKLTEEDYRNRDKWSDYEDAAEDMLTRTHTSWAPWHIIPGNSKSYARCLVAEALATAIEEHLNDSARRP